jgi:hypothetical protein
MKPFRLALAAALAVASLSAHAVGRLADITVFDRSTGRELPVYWHEGRAYVVGRPGNEYQVGVRNRRGEDVLAVVSVDGVNVVSGETATTRQSGYVVNAWQRLDIQGWRKNLGETAAFYFTSLADSYAARTGRPDNVGVIGVALFPRKRVLPPPPVSVAPSQEPWDSSAAPYREEARRDKSADSNMQRERQQPPAAGFAQSAPLGTGHGRREESAAQWVNFERASDTPAETITIHYDSYRNLVARGILASPVAPRQPNPFPGFVPDPA